MNSVVTEDKAKELEEEKIQSALSRCGYPKWTFTEVKEQVVNKQVQRKNKVEGIAEKATRILRRHDIAKVVSPHTTLRKLLVHPKDKRDSPSTTGCIHEVICVNCNESYVGETGRRLERLNEDKKETEKDEKSKRNLLVKLENNLKVSSLNLLSQTTRSSITTSLIGNMQKSLHRSVSRMCTILRKPSGSDVVHPT